MKKLITAIILCAFFICIGGCSGDSQKTMWNMQSIQAKDGKVVYCSEKNKDSYADAKLQNIVCVLQESSVTITDKTTGKEWTGACKKIDSTKNNTTMYEVEFDNKETGNMVKGITKYLDNTQENTLIISSGEYVLNFTENTEK